MGSISRRDFVKGVAALPLAMGVSTKAWGQSTLRIRYDIASPDGQQMMAIYVDAVRQMQALGPDNPMSWMWQWYTHFVNGTTTKADEITRIFGTTITNTACLDPTQTSDTASVLQSLNNRRVFWMYSGYNDYAVATMFGRGFTVDLSANN